MVRYLTRVVLLSMVSACLVLVFFDRPETETERGSMTLRPGEEKVIAVYECDSGSAEVAEYRFDASGTLELICFGYSYSGRSPPLTFQLLEEDDSAAGKIIIGNGHYSFELRNPSEETSVVVIYTISHRLAWPSEIQFLCLIAGIMVAGTAARYMICGRAWSIQEECTAEYARAVAGPGLWVRH